MGILPMNHGLEARATSFGYFGTSIAAVGGQGLAMTVLAKAPGIFEELAELDFMNTPLKITWPIEGDILDHHDGAEHDGTLSIKVCGHAAPGSQVRVNGIETATTQQGAFEATVPLDKRRNKIRAESGDTAHEITVWWNEGSRKRFRFSVDDNICFLRDLGLAPKDYPSLFDHPFLGFWREMHQEFGAKIHLNIYYQTDGFDLTEMPGNWREEWQANASWLHLSFHALQDKPDRPYRNATYAQLAHDYDLVCGHIRRFAGNEVLSNTTTVHWAQAPKDAVAALRDRGVQQLIALFDVQGYGGVCTTGYYLPQDQCTYCDTRGAWHDRDTGLTFIRCAAVVNSLELTEIPAFLERRTATPQTEDMLELLIHEQYFRKELSYYQPDILDKVRVSMKWAVDHGYEPVFWSEGFLGTPSA